MLMRTARAFNLANRALFANNARMAYGGIRTKPEHMAPRREPPRPAAKNTAQAPPDDEDDSFPDTYQPAMAAARAAAPLAAPALDAGFERLIELAAGCLGCPHEELLDLKARAASNPAPIAAYCQSIFDQRLRPLREASDPLAADRGPGRIAFWLEGLQGRAVGSAPFSAALAPYHMATIELHAPERTPFAKLIRARQKQQEQPPQERPAPAVDF